MRTSHSPYGNIKQPDQNACAPPPSTPARAASMRPQYGREDDARVAHVACMGDSIASTAGKPQPRAGAGDNGTHRPCCTKALTQPPPLTTSAPPHPPLLRRYCSTLATQRRGSWPTTRRTTSTRGAVSPAERIGEEARHEEAQAHGRVARGAFIKETIKPFQSSFMFFLQK